MSNGADAWPVTVTVRIYGTEMRHPDWDEVQDALQRLLVGQVVLDGSFYGIASIEAVEVQGFPEP